MAKSTGGLALNTVIARSHQFTTQMISVQLSIANLLAISVSAASVVAGCVTVTALKYPTSYILWAAAGVIGLGLAILIEGMTLGALIRIRIANKRIKEVEEQIEKTFGDIGFWAQLWPWTGYNRKKARATRLHRRSRSSSIPLVIVGSISSAIAGGLFYHTVLAGLGQVESLVVAGLFPFVVTCTFISSELFKDIQEEAIKEGFSGGGLSESALKEETRRLLLQSAHDDLVSDLNDPEVKARLKEKRLKVLVSTFDELLIDSGKSSDESSATAQVTVTEEVNAEVPLLSDTTATSADTTGATATTTTGATATTPVLSEETPSDTPTPPADRFLAGVFADVFAPDQDVPQEENLTKTLAFFDSHPQAATTWTQDDDVALAEHLGLTRVASARFWRLRALEVWTPKTPAQDGSDGLAVAGVQEDAQATQDRNRKPDTAKAYGKAARSIGQENERRVAEYVAAHPAATAKEIADAIHLSPRAVQRHLAAISKPRLKLVSRQEEELARQERQEEEG